ncbi:hypothetical protein C8263_02530 [Deinococcus arcticus]|uniref:Uncharacterized protein n=1 Tax=Deinococcus arcticus TaxID=2136176 RepID=A0A2T3WBF5_9DEIO|nr:hypothetical protein C8263_02530 [Deinococcus arcticus]
MEAFRCAESSRTVTFDDWTLYLVFAGYFLGAILWFLNRWVGGALLAAGALGTLLSPTLLEDVGVYLSKLFVALVCGAALGFWWFGRRQRPDSNPAPAPEPPITEAQREAKNAQIRLMIGGLFWSGALSFSLEIGRNANPLMAVLFALFFFSLGGIFLPGALSVRVALAAVLAGLAALVGLALGPV